MPEFIASAFVSYTREDELIARQIVDRLRIDGVEVFFDRDRIRPGTPWEQALEDAIANHTYFIPLFSDSYGGRAKHYMKQELEHACKVIHTALSPQIQILPVRLTPCAIPDIPITATHSLRSIQWIDYFENSELAIFRLIQNLIVRRGKIQNY